MKYLDKLLSRKREWYKLNVEDIIHKIDSEDYRESYWAEEQIKESVDKMVLYIAIELESNEDFLHLDTANNLINYCRNRLDKESRNLYRWEDITKLTKEIKSQIKPIRKVLGR